MNSEVTRDQLRRVNVVGTSGSGKSTVAKILAKSLDCPWIEMDRLFWEPEWTQASDEVFFARLEEATSGEVWVIDGNYSRWQQTMVNKITAIVWVDYSFVRTLRQAVARAVKRAWTQTEIWPGTGNRESFRRSFFSHDSVVLWTITSFRRNRKKYAEMMRDPKLAHIRFVRLKSPRQSQQFLESLEQ